MKDQDNYNNQYSTNRYMVCIEIKTYVWYLIKLSQNNCLLFQCYVHVNLDDLHAEIVGGPVRQVSNSELVTLDASLSYNPNEPKYRQDQVFYTWICDVKTDRANCLEYITSSSSII